jgi:transcriptional regulator with XRE-family HTH domain
MKTFAAALARELEGSGKTAYRLAQESGVSDSMLSKLLAGKIQPSWLTVQKLSVALGVSCEAFKSDVQLPAPPAARGPGRPPAPAKKSRKS